MFTFRYLYYVAKVPVIYVMMNQNDPPTPVRKNKYLAIPPTLLPLRNIKMALYFNHRVLNSFFWILNPITPRVSKSTIFLIWKNFAFKTFIRALKFP